MKQFFAIICTVISLVAFGQNGKKSTFEGNFFSISYPADWTLEREGEIVNIFPANEIGAITISGYEGINFDEKQTKQMILDLYKSSDSTDKVQTKKKNGMTEYYYEYFDDTEKMNWVTKILKKGEELQLITINCEQKFWNGNYRMMFLDSFNSYKPAKK